MARYLDEYRRKVISIDNAVSEIKSFDNIYVSGNASTPYTFLKTLAEHGSELQNVSVAHVLFMAKDDPLLSSKYAHAFRHISWFAGPVDRTLINEGKAEYIPIFLHEIPKLILNGTLKVDTAILNVSPPDEHGFMSLGTEVIASKAAAKIAKKIIVQVNDKMPRVLGDTFIHISQVHKIVELSEPLKTLEMEEPTEVEKKIGENIASLIEDGATLQMGIGGIPNAVLSYIKEKHDLGVHTEMISDGTMELIEKGVINGWRKTIHPNKVIATFILGSQKFYDFVHNNPIIEAHPCDYTNDPEIISKNDNMVAINSAIEVDITGQVCSDSIGTKIYSGFGGQLDFIRGAAHAKNGKPIIAIPSTTKDGSLSKIVPVLKSGAGVVTTRGDVHYVVTEFGVANLHGLPLRQRVKELIRIAHPDFRGVLERAARERNLI